MSNASRYDPVFADSARVLCGDGAVDGDLAQAFGVPVETIHDWRQRHPDFSAAIRLGREIADDLVEAALFRRAIGYSYQSERLFSYGGAITRVETVEHVPPSERAAIFWLKNRRPRSWRDRIEEEGPEKENFARMLAEARARLEARNDR